MSVNQWSARECHLVAVVMAESSLNRTEVMVTLPTSSTTRGACVVAHVVLPADLTNLSCLLMFGGGGQSSANLSALGPPLLQYLVESLC